jgi:hypothetical protein
MHKGRNYREQIMPCGQRVYTRRKYRLGFNMAQHRVKCNKCQILELNGLDAARTTIFQFRFVFDSRTSLAMGWARKL